MMIYLYVILRSDLGLIHDAKVNMSDPLPFICVTIQNGVSMGDSSIFVAILMGERTINPVNPTGFLKKECIAMMFR